MRKSAASYWLPIGMAERVAGPVSSAMVCAGICRTVSAARPAGLSGRAIKDPDASIKAGQKVKPEMETALSLAQLKVGIGLIKSPTSKDLPIGQFAAQDWTDTVELMKTYQDLQTDMKPEGFYTNDFVATPQDLIAIRPA